ncbi:hypothetical protein ACF0H5_012163 [Mactra antiquata]
MGFKIRIFCLINILVLVTCHDSGNGHTHDENLTQQNGVQYKFIKNKRSWMDADEDCRSREGSLLVINTHSKVSEFQKRMLLDAQDAIWTAAYRQHSPWVWVEGCFSASFLSKHDGVRISTNKAADCATMCRDSTYAALKSYMCFCLEDMRDLLPLNARACDTPCPGAPAEVCGGDKGAVSLYSLGGVNGYKESDKEVSEELQQTVHEISRSDWKNCVYILKHDTPVWVTADCRKTLPFLCKIYRDNGAMVEYTSPKKTYGSWMESRDICRKMGGTLADLHANNMEAVNALPDHSEYWVGLYRNTSWTWHTEKREEKPNWCTSVSEDKLGELHFMTESCSIPKQYVCQIPLRVAKAENHQMMIYLICGSIVWILAIVTGILMFYFMRKRGCCKKGSGDHTGSRSYLDLDEQSINTASTSVQSRPHSYVNSDVSNLASCSRPPPSNDVNDGKCKGQTSGAKYHSGGGNEYASVCMKKNRRSENVDSADCGKGASNRGSTSTSEGEYDVVWDSVNFTKHLNSLGKAAKRESTTSENIYSEIEKVAHVDLPEDDYLVAQPTVYPSSQSTSSVHQI